MTRKHLAIALVLAIAPLSAHAAGGMDYSYIGAGWMKTDIDGVGDGYGPALEGAIELGANVHLFGGYARQSESEQGIDVDLDALRFGVGYNRPFNERVDFVARAAYERMEMEASDGAASADARIDGISVEAGIRGLLNPSLEGWLMGGFAEVDRLEIEGDSVATDSSEDHQAYGRVGLQLKFAPTSPWGLVGEARISDEYQQYFAGVRASF